MKPMKWAGVIPAITTPFNEDMTVDHAFLAKHCQWLVDNGCTGVVALGSLGEGATLTVDEKRAVLKTCVAAIGDRAFVVSGVSALSTDEAVEIAKLAHEVGCDGLMVLPPYVYVGDWREMKAHVASVMAATPLSSMLYNNPIAYKVDFLPHQVAELMAECGTLHAIKESSADVRRIAELRRLLGDRLHILCGVDDLIVEALLAGAEGWIAGLVNAFPRESVDLYNYTKSGNLVKAFELYLWFLPLLRLDVVPKFVQLIKWVQQEVGMGSERVRAPRLALVGAEREAVSEVLRVALENKIR